MSIDTRTIIGNAVRSVALFEGLESRQMMSSTPSPAAVAFENHQLVIRGTAADDSIHVSWTEAGRKVRVKMNGKLSHAFDGRQLWSVNVDAGNGDNRVTIDEDFRSNVSITTGKGNDTIVTALGNDGVYSGAGADRVSTGKGNDIVWAGSGNDTLNGGAGNDLLVAESGNDVVATGGEGTSTVYAGSGTNQVVATSADIVDNGASQGGTSNIVLDGAAVTPTPTPTPIPTPTPTRTRISSLSLVNADTGKVLNGYENLTGNVTLDLDKLPTHITIVANVDGSRVGSAKFVLNGNGAFSRVENNEPMTLTASNPNGGFNAWSPTNGNYTLIVTPYGADDAQGQAGNATTVQFTVTRSSQQQQPPQQQNNGGTVVGPVSPDAPRIAITTLQGSTVAAGRAFHIEATGTTIPGADAEDAAFAWDFGDAGSRYNQMPGFNAAHVYDRPGTYTVRLTVTAANGQSSTQALTVTVTAAVVAKTLYVAADGNDANAGTASYAPLRTLARAIALAGDDTSVLLRRGDTFWQSSTVEIKRSGLTLSSYGSAASAPTLMWTGTRDRSNVLWVDASTSNVTVRGITFDSIYNGDTEQTGMPTAILVGGKSVTLRENTFLNIGYCINSNQNPHGMLVQDNRAPNEVGVRDYFVWTQGSDIVIVGNEVANSTREHNVRVSGVDRLTIAFNKLTNLDRTPLGDAKDNAKGTIACQKGSFAYIADNQLRGPAGVGPLGGDNGLGNKAARFTHARVEDNVQYNDTFYLQHGAEHVTLTGNTIYAEGGIAFDVVGWNNVYQRGNLDIAIVGNVAVNNAARGNFLVVEAAAQGITLTDNVYVAPYLAPGSFGAAAVFVNGSDLSSFARIDHNTWPSTARANAYARGGMTFADTTYSSSGHKTPGEWNNLPQVGDDSFEDVNLDNARLRIGFSSNSGVRLAA